jgi:predicted DNA binding CopG/RHH family protein
MYIQMIQEESQAKQHQSQRTEQQQQHHYEYQRKYPRFSSVRLSHKNIERIKARATKYNQTIDDLVTIILGQLGYYERQGYETLEAERSF